jgi:hypothetical protein
MKACIIAATLLIPPLLWGANSKIELGQSREQTIEALGKPIGVIELKDKVRLLYPQGEITIHDDRVSAIDLMSDTEYNKEQERLRIEREDWQVQQEKRAEERVKAGEELKAYKLQSSTFAGLPAKDRVDYWRSFQMRFPEVDVAEQISHALEGYNQEIVELKNQQQIAELQARVAMAEKEAAAATLETERLRKEAEATSNSSYRLRTYYPAPYYYRPPIIVYPGQHNGTHDNNQSEVDRWKWDKNKSFYKNAGTSLNRVIRRLEQNESTAN